MWGAVAGAVAGGVMDMISNHQQNQNAERVAHDTRDWEERMSNTAHQREVADLRAAGLNPMLSAGGTGATTPGINMPVVNSVIKDAAGTGLNAARIAAEIDQLKANTKKADADTAVDKAMEQRIGQETRVTALDAKLRESQLPGAKEEAKIDESWYGRLTRHIQRLLPAANTAVRAAATAVK